MAKIYVVNEQDEVITLKERGTLAPTDIYRISALWLRNSQGKILMAQRALSKSSGAGKWGPAVAGTVEEGETYEVNIVKEAREELGIEGLVLVPGEKERAHTHTEYFCQWYFATLDRELEDFVLQEEEVAGVKWFDPEELKDRIATHPDDFTYGMRNRERLAILGLA